MGRRAKYLLADLSSGDVLVMHLGMSGSFRVAKNGGVAPPGRYYHERNKQTAHDHVVFHMSSGAVVSFNDPRRSGSMKLVARRDLGDEPLLRWLGPEPLGNELMPRWRKRARARKPASRRLARSNCRGRARQHLRLRGAQPRAAVAAPHRLDAGDADRRSA